VTTERKPTAGLLLVAAAFVLASCRSLDPETANATICATQKCLQDVECPTGLLFRKGDNRLRYIEGDRDKGIRCRFALEEAGIARVKSSRCGAGDQRSQPCVENTVVPVVPFSSFHSESYRGISAKRLFLRYGVRRTEVVDVVRKGERYLVRLKTVLEPSEGFEKVRECCIGPEEVSKKPEETSVYVCREDGQWTVCGK